MIREAPTTSSSESNFTDPESPNEDISKTLNLVVTKLEHLELISQPPTLEIVHNESLSFNGGETKDETMPIVEKSPPENGSDRGMFSVSRVKKVELSEIPLASDICECSVKQITHTR